MTFKRFTRLPVFRQGRNFRKDVFKPPTPKQEDLTSDAFDKLVRHLNGDITLAKRIQKLQEKFPNQSIPELLCYDWLTKEHIQFVFQAAIMGGKFVKGGLIPDFVLKTSPVTVWQIQGDFWHDVSRKGYRDEVSNLRMIGQNVEGYTIERVLSLWEGDLLMKRPLIFTMALAGMSLKG